ncbi:MAG TPA: Rieske (2Fe-2S) protein [Terriglobales bacterium]|nr:Rieske (2Fe-2S) protein [Terriglobales bacterium]
MSADMKDCETCAGCAKAPKWRTDFPIEWEGDHYVSRREMVKFLTLGSLLLAGANWLTAFAAGLTRKGSQKELPIGPVAKLNETGYILFRYPTDRDPCIAVRSADGGLFAYSQVCTHLSCAVVFNRKANTLDCPCHKGVFNVPEGRPIAGPPTRPLPRVRIVQRGDQLFATALEA